MQKNIQLSLMKQENNSVQVWEDGTYNVLCKVSVPYTEIDEIFEIMLSHFSGNGKLIETITLASGANPHPVFMMENLSYTINLIKKDIVTLNKKIIKIKEKK